MDKMKFRSDFVIRTIGQEYVVVDPGQEIADLTNLYTLNESAALLINTFKDLEFTHDDVVSVLMDHYNVDRALADSDADKWLKLIATFGFLAVR